MKVFLAAIWMMAVGITITMAQKTPLLSIPIQFGSNQDTINLYEGDNVRTVAAQFLAEKNLPGDQIDGLIEIISQVRMCVPLSLSS